MSWLCLTSGRVYCGRYASGHGLNHWRDTMPSACGSASSKPAAAAAAGEEAAPTAETTAAAATTADVVGERGDDALGSLGGHHEALGSLDGLAACGQGHCLALSLSDLSIWCHACGAYVKHDRLVPLLEAARRAKFGDNDEGGGGDATPAAAASLSEQAPASTSAAPPLGPPPLATCCALIYDEVRVKLTMRTA